MKRNTSVSIASELMNEFADQTGLSPAGNKPRRYLWTDAFAVCNFLERYCQTGNEEYKKWSLFKNFLFVTLNLFQGLITH